MLPSDMNLRIGIGKVKDYNNKILISTPSFKNGTNLKINLDVKSKEVEMLRTEPDVKPKVITKRNIEPNEKHRQDVKPNIKFDRENNQDVKEPDTNKITYEEEKVALVLGTTAVFTVWSPSDFLSTVIILPPLQLPCEKGQPWCRCFYS